MSRTQIREDAKLNASMYGHEIGEKQAVDRKLFLLPYTPTMPLKMQQQDRFIGCLIYAIAKRSSI
ncbi:hypothetical protein H6F98_20030 [Microcoleus sp. FACHB-SPT15]|uniref:hypothetical protein n=1 Tax=Microcoleus sp. FACHB-SPT15 TaxID=2692830 RepID=UPI00178744C8|nr:hypothetical protein [Microcoleus sp. FACHB-SPT15]MBD1807718.1 hypothetical protein [Microcoleus sp. FACHB-SPT15]